MPVDGSTHFMKFLKWLAFIIGYPIISIAVPILTTWPLAKFLCWKEPVVGSITAVIVVLYSYFASPGYRPMAAIIGFIVGALLAYQLPDMHWYPECHPKAYMSTLVPLALTYGSGFVALLVILWRSNSRSCHAKSISKRH